MSVNKELRELVQAVEEKGFTVEPSNGHQKIYYEGRPVLYEEVPGDETTRRPVTLPSTPSDSRWRDDTVALLVRARVLDEDPFRAGQAGLTDEDRERRESEREEREQRQERARVAREAQSEASRALAEETNAVRERARAVLEPIGVWRTTGDAVGAGRPRRSIGEAARLAHSLAVKKGVEPAPPASPNAAQVAIRKFFDGEGGMRNVAWIEVLLDELEASPDPVRHYFALLRDELGLEEGGPRREEPAPAEPAPPLGAEPLEIEAEDDERIRELRARLEEEATSRRAIESALETERAAVGELHDALEEIGRQRDEIRRQRDEALAEAGSADGAVVPELAFEALAEMIGQHVTVAPEEANNLEGILTMLNEKKERATALAKRIAALELGIEAE